MLRNKIKNYIYKPNTLGNYVFIGAQTLVNSLRYNRYMDEIFTKKRFINNFGYQLNLNSPQTFNEKIQWLLLNDMDDFKTLCTDKYLVREYIKNEIGEKYLIPVVYHTAYPEDIIAEKLPDYPVIIKTNHASGQVFIIKDKSELNLNKTQESLALQLRKNFYHPFREKQYKNIKPRILVEKLLQDEHGNIPKDYKLHCFNGQPTYIQVDTGRYVDQKRVIYDVNWNHIDIKWKENKGEQEDKPITLLKMLEVAKILSKKFIYVRVDLYEVDGSLFFGELTFTPGAGQQKFESLEVDKLWGDQLKLPIDDTI
jgi:hypothetical protein